MKTLESLGFKKENRGNTAIARKSISKPLKECLKRGVFEGVTSILDNGCGKGIDFKYLKELNYDSKGFDPYQKEFRDNTDLLSQKYDVVTSTFVINVIEDPKEVEYYIKKTYEMAKNKVVFSARFDKKAVKENWISLPDGGYITPKKTYQKFYNKESLKALIEKVLNIRLDKTNSLQFGETIVIKK